MSVILKETFDMITGDGRSCATRAILEVPSPGSARGPEHECSGLLAIIGTRGYVGTPDTLPTWEICVSLKKKATRIDVTENAHLTCLVAIV